MWRSWLWHAGVLSALLLAPEDGTAQWPVGIHVADTPHNLLRPARNNDSDMQGRIRDYSDVCVYCHVPHAANTVQTPLWNRRRTTTAYRMYSGGSMIIDPSPNDASRLCLSCHDGSIGLDDVLNLPNSYAGPGAAQSSIRDCEGCHGGGSPAGGIDWEGVWIEPDLRKMHPVSVIYDPSRNPTFNPASVLAALGFPLFNGRVECLTCHDPHTQRYRPFLRRNNSGNSLCLVCHQTDPGGDAHAW